jgi:hypothetical protein
MSMSPAPCQLCEKYDAKYLCNGCGKACCFHCITPYVVWSDDNQQRKYQKLDLCPECIENKRFRPMNTRLNDPHEPDCIIS